MSLRPARALRPALAVVGALALAAAGGSASLAAAAPAAGTSGSVTPHLAGRYSDYVNPIIGTSGYVDTFPGPDVPFGMVQLGPDTSPDRPAGGGYEYDDKDLRGFSLSHVSGPGCGAGGDLPMLPVSGDVGSDPASLVQPFSHTGEVAKAGFYQVTTGTGASAVTSKMSTTTRAASPSSPSPPARTATSSSS